MPSTKNNLFRHINGEEGLNDFFVSLLARGDVADILNLVHDDIEFDSTARVIATQRSGLDRDPDENSSRRILDWVVQDKSKIVGYESKTNDPLGGSQLREERRKLELNSRGRDVYLYAITEDIRKPSLDAEYSWLSWSDVGKNLIDARDNSAIIELLADMMENEGYDGFRGFTPYERDEGWFITHQNEAVDFALEVAERAKGLQFYDKDRVDLHNRTVNRVSTVKNRGSRSLGPSYYVFPIHPEEYRDSETDYNISRNGWYIAIVVPALHNTVYVQMNIYLSKKEEFRATFDEYAEELSEIMVAHGMKMWTSANSLNQEQTPEVYEDPDEIVDILENRGGEGHFKRVRPGWDLDGSEAADELIQTTVEKLELLHEIFYDGVNRRKSFD